MDYPAVSSHCRGRLQPWERERDPLPGRGLRAPRGRDWQVRAAPPPPEEAAQTGQGWGRRGCVTFELEKSPRSALASSSEPGVGSGPLREAMGEEALSTQPGDP